MGEEGIRSQGTGNELIDDNTGGVVLSPVAACAINTEGMCARQRGSFKTNKSVNRVHQETVAGDSYINEELSARATLMSEQQDEHVPAPPVQPSPTSVFIGNGKLYKRRKTRVIIVPAVLLRIGNVVDFYPLGK